MDPQTMGGLEPGISSLLETAFPLPELGHFCACPSMADTADV